MNDKKIDNIVDKTLELIEKDNHWKARPWFDDDDEYYNYIDWYFLNKKEYMKLLINGKITNTQRKIHDLIEENHLEANKKFMRNLVKLERQALKYASEELQNDKEVVLEAVKKYGNALQYASKGLQNDKEVVFQAQKTIIMKEIEIGRNKR